MPRESSQERLDTYRRMRDFGQTPEPSGDEAAGNPAERRFVVQEHHARRLHWDLRLEHEGVLVSWAIPKGFPPDRKINRLAVHTEDHPLAYLDFAGVIPAGEYGGGQMNIWDRGTYECHEFTPRKVVITLRGRRLRGRYALFQTDGKNWMIHRIDVLAGREPAPMPGRLIPMKAQPASLPPDDAKWAFEIKWDGVRALAYLADGRMRLQSRNLKDLTAQYPEVRELADVLGERAAVFDGELVALDENGIPRFERLQQRMGLTNPADIGHMRARVPVVYMLFDLLYLDGDDLTRLAYRERRRMLEDLHLAGTAWQTPGYHVGDGEAMLAASRQRGLEGVMAKRLDCPYEPGRRSPDWRKIKNSNRQEFVVGGWQWGEGARNGRIGSLLVGYYEGDRLRYAGSVGSGFSEATLDRLAGLLEPLRYETSPFTEGDVKRGAVYVEPRLVAEVEFNEFTRAGLLRQPVFKGLRDDKDPREVVRET